MARKRYSDEDALKILREIDVHLHDGLDVVGACRKAGISDKTYYYWRKKFGGLGRPQLSEMKALKKENERLKKIVAHNENLYFALSHERGNDISFKFSYKNRPLKDSKKYKYTKINPNIKTI